MKLEEAVSVFCDKYCHYPFECQSQDELDEHCENCEIIRNGVIPFPCNIGDTVYAIRNHRGEKYPHKGVVSEMYFTSDMSLMIVVKNIARGQWGKEVFRTEEEAEKALEGING